MGAMACPTVPSSILFWSRSLPRTATVTNTGDVAGVEVAQLYLGFPDGFGEPSKLLRGFHRLPFLTKDQSVVAQFPLYERDLQICTPGIGWERPSGTFKIYVGPSAG